MMANDLTNVSSRIVTKGLSDPVSSPETSLEGKNLPDASRAESERSLLPPPSDTAMGEYYQLQQTLLVCTLAFSGVVFLFAWGFYSLNLALNYLIGACTGVVYLRMLAKNVGELGRTRQKLGSARLALFIGLIVLATQWNQLEIMPIFLGFLTYKFALIAYTIWTAVLLE